MTRGGIYGEIYPKHVGNPKGADQGISQGLRLCFTIFPHLSYITDILNFQVIIPILSFLVGQYWKS